MKEIDDGKLQKRQYLAIRHLIEGLSKAEIARKVGVCERTVWAWLRRPDFQAALLKARETLKPELEARDLAYLLTKVGEARRNPKLQIKTIGEYHGVMDRIFDRVGRLHVGGEGILSIVGDLDALPPATKSGLAERLLRGMEGKELFGGGLLALPSGEQG